MSSGGGSFRRGGGSSNGGTGYGNRGSSGGGGYAGGNNRFRNGSGNGGSRFGAGGGRNNSGGGGPAGSRLRKPNWDMKNLRPFKKDFYVPHPSVANRSPYEIEQFRRSKEITVDGREIPPPIQHFEEASFPDYVMQVCTFIFVLDFRVLLTFYQTYLTHLGLRIT